MKSFAKIITVLVLVAFFQGSLCASAKPFSSGAWLEDFEELKAHLASYYANLDAKVARGLNAYELNQRTTEALKGAKNDREAFLALVAFIAAFQDGHVRITNETDMFPKYLGSRRKYDFEIAFKEQNVVYRGSSKKCGLVDGDILTHYNGKPINDAIEYQGRFQRSYSPIDRRILASSSLIRGFFLSDGVEIKGLHKGTQKTCSFKAVPNERQKPPTIPVDKISNKTDPELACESLGISNEAYETATAIPKLQTFKSLPNRSFQVGTLNKNGYLHLPGFGSFAYFETCRTTWLDYQRTFKGSCDENCREKFLYNKLWQTMTDDLKQAIDDLNIKGVERLYVDVTGNGGGSDWVDIVSRMLSSENVICPGVALVRSPKVQSNLSSLRDELSSDLKIANQAQKEILSKSITRLDRMLEEFDERCDRSDYWSKKNFKPKCSPLLKTRKYACGMLPYVEVSKLKGLKHPGSIFGAADFTFQEKLFKKDLKILVDHETSSAAELFVAQLKDSNPKIKIIGEHTNSTGCGYYNGGNLLMLKNSKIKVNQSSCSRFRKNGDNEVFGIEPDVEINWADMTPVRLESELKTW